MRKVGEQEENQSFHQNLLLETQLSLLLLATTLRQKIQIHLGKLKMIVRSYVTVKLKIENVSIQTSSVFSQFLIIDINKSCNLG